MHTQKIITLLTDTIVAAASAIEKVNDPKDAERTIKSAYYGLDNALTLIRREISPAPRD